MGDIQQFHWADINTEATASLSPHQIHELSTHPDLLKVVVVPSNDGAMANRMFASTFIQNDHWMQPNVHLFTECIRQKILISTWDILAFEKADIVLFIDLPLHVGAWDAFQRSGSKAKRILMLYESPVGKPFWFDARNHSRFDAILTYNLSLVDHQRYFPFCLPLGLASPKTAPLTFSQRRLSVLVNSNIRTKLIDRSRPWHAFREWQVWRRHGLHYSLGALLRNHRRTSYPLRAEIARAGERFGSESLDVYGSNWTPLKSGWFRRFFPERPYRCKRGTYSGNKLDLLAQYRFCFAVENYCGDEYYISEKVFDALLAGTVPVYFGDTHLKEILDPDSFIDGSRFASLSSLFSYLREMPEAEWESRRAHGARTLTEAGARKYQAEAYLNSLTTVFRSLAASL